MNKTVRSAFLLAVLAGLVGLVVYDSFVRQPAVPDSADSPTIGRTSDDAAVSTPTRTDRRSNRLELPQRPPLDDSRTGLFSSHSWDRSASRQAALKTAPIAPRVPPMPYRFVGALVHDGKLQVLLATGNTVVPVREGETIEGGYRVDSITEDRITLTYLPLRKQEVIPFFSALLPEMKRGALAKSEPESAPSATAKASVNQRSAHNERQVRATGSSQKRMDKAANEPARVLWHGPNQVQLGKQFSVSLRVTSSQPVRASPMRIKVNPALLETVAVKPGQFFGENDRDFGYRVNPDGSIFVAATSQNPVPAANAELVVLTFMPRKTTSAAELTIASLNLQGPAGQPIAFGQPEAFRTAIAP